MLRLSIHINRVFLTYIRPKTFKSHLGVCLIGTNSENDRLGRFGRPAEPSAPKAEVCADFGEISDLRQTPGTPK